MRHGLADRANELPVIAARMQGQLEDPEGATLAQLAVGLDERKAAEVAPTSAHDELADAVRQVEVLAWILGGEALVIMVVRVQDHVRSRSVQILPERAVRGEIAAAPGAPAHLMPEGQDAGVGMGGQVCLEPLLLGAARRAADVGTLGIEGDEVPGPQV